MSLSEINQALLVVTERINTRVHTRLKRSRRDLFNSQEKLHLKALPDAAFEFIEWRSCRVHPDATVAVDNTYYSVPYTERGRELRVKITHKFIEIYAGLDKIAQHLRDKRKCGSRILNPLHLPPNTLAYQETTPQNLLSQARFVSLPLFDLIEALFLKDTLGNLRRAQGLIRAARSEILNYGRTEATLRIEAAILSMQRFETIKVGFFTEFLKKSRTQKLDINPEEYVIERSVDNPMLRLSAAPGRPS